MKAQFAVIAAALFAASASVSADHFYGDFAKANSDLNGSSPAAARVTVVPSPAANPIGVHGGLGPDNPDLVTTTGKAGAAEQFLAVQPGIGDRFNVYRELGLGNPDLVTGTDD